MRILLYGNGASGNHGCEAIVRGTIALLNSPVNTFCIYSDNSEQDIKYGLEQLAEVKDARKPTIPHDYRFLFNYILMKITKDHTIMDGLYYLDRVNSSKNTFDVALSVGGDNYCYGTADIYRFLNKEYHKKNIKTVLWGCSVEPAVSSNEKIVDDLKRYDLIVARESITYQFLSGIKPNTVLSPDPAFCMKPEECILDSRFHQGKVVGINISPMIISNEKENNVTLQNYLSLIEYILEQTDNYVALIPHVIWNNNDDRKPLNELYRCISDQKRVIVVEDHTAPELKYIISKCKIFVGARTHATIAAYSSCVPTLVVGYSVKAKGIALDLFGTDEHYVIPVQTLKNSTDLLNEYIWLSQHENKIRSHLEKKMPEYIGQCRIAKEALYHLGK